MHSLKLHYVGCLLLLIVSSARAQESRGVLYEIGAKWCGPCQQVAPILERLEREGLPIRKIDFDENREFASQHRVEQIPTFILVIDGREVERHTGALSEAEIRKMVAKIPQAQPAGNNGAVTMPIQLGQPGAFPQPNATPQRSLPQGPRETRVAEVEEPKKGLRDLWPFQKKQPGADETPSVVRATDAGLPQEPVAGRDPLQASVRIRVITNDLIDIGSGTIIDTQPGMTRILTCAHIFKKIAPNSKIEVDLFEGGHAKLHLATLVKTDDAADLGLITCPTDRPVSLCRIGAPDSMPKVRDKVSAVGCSGGEDPTLEHLEITDINKYEEPHNILCTGVPVRGRSGGGLFNAEGAVIGVCSAADPQDQRGFYSGLKAIHAFLDVCGLTALYQPSAPVETAIAAAETEPASQSPFDRAAVSAPTPGAAPGPQPTSSLIDASSTVPQQIAASGAEAIVILKDKSRPDSPQQVLIFHQVSPKFYSYLTGQIDGPQVGDLSEAQSLPLISRSPRVNEPAALAARERALPTAAKEQLQPTGLQQVLAPQRYVRSASSR